MKLVNELRERRMLKGDAEVLGNWTTFLPDGGVGVEGGELKNENCSSRSDEDIAVEAGTAGEQRFTSVTRGGGE